MSKSCSFNSYSGLVFWGKHQSQCSRKCQFRTIKSGKFECGGQHEMLLDFLHKNFSSSSLLGILTNCLCSIPRRPDSWDAWLAWAIGVLKGRKALLSFSKFLGLLLYIQLGWRKLSMAWEQLKDEKTTFNIIVVKVRWTGIKLAYCEFCQKQRLCSFWNIPMTVFDSNS